MDFDRVADELAEPFQHYGDPIVAGDEEGNAIAAFGIGRRRRDDAGGNVEDLDGGAGDSAAARIDDAALDRAAGFLRRGAGADEGHHGEHAQKGPK
jgi:hypothetical protein